MSVFGNIWEFNYGRKELFNENIYICSISLEIVACNIVILIMIKIVIKF